MIWPWTCIIPKSGTQTLLPQLHYWYKVCTASPTRWGAMNAKRSSRAPAERVRTDTFPRPVHSCHRKNLQLTSFFFLVSQISIPCYVSASKCKVIIFAKAYSVPFGSVAFAICPACDGRSFLVLDMSERLLLPTVRVFTLKQKRIFHVRTFPLVVLYANISSPFRNTANTGWHRWRLWCCWTLCPLPDFIYVRNNPPRRVRDRHRGWLSTATFKQTN